MKTTAAVPKPFLDLLPHRATSDLVREIERNAQWLHDTKARGKTVGRNYRDKLLVLVPELKIRLEKSTDESEKHEIRTVLGKAESVLRFGDVRASKLESFHKVDAMVETPSRPAGAGMSKDDIIDIIKFEVDAGVVVRKDEDPTFVFSLDDYNKIDNILEGADVELLASLTAWNDLAWKALHTAVRKVVGDHDESVLKAAFDECLRMFNVVSSEAYWSELGASGDFTSKWNTDLFDVGRVEKLVHAMNLSTAAHRLENAIFTQAYKLVDRHRIVKRGPEHDNVVYRFDGTNNSIAGASAKGMYVAKLGLGHLLDESVEMGHCIGNEQHGHPRLLRNGYTEVYSLRTTSGKTTFTIEYFIKDGLHPQQGRVQAGKVTEVKGKANRLPGFESGSSTMTKPDDVRRVVDFLVNYLKLTPAQIEGTKDIRAGVLAMKAAGVDPFSPPPVRKRPPPSAEVSSRLLSASMRYAKMDHELAASLVEAAPYDGWKDLKPGKLATPIELEDAEGLWKAIAERIGHDPEKGVEMRAPIIGGRRRYHHRPLRSYHLSNDRTLTLTTDELEAKTWNNLKAKRHPAMPRVYDTFSVKKKGEKEAKLWAIVHEQLAWPIEENWNLFVDSFFKWRAMEREALSPAKATDLEGFLRWVIDPEQADPNTTQKNRIEVVLPWKMTRQRRDDVADRRKKLFALPDLEEKIKWAKSALQYLKQNKVKFRDFDPSNLAMTKKGDRVVITNLAESRSIPTKTGRTGRVKGSASSTAPVRGVTVYHGTNNKFEKFDFSKSNDVGIWFTSDPEAIKRNEVGSQGNKYIREHSLTLNNPAGWDEYDRLTLSELIQRGYDGVVMPDEDKVNYLVFHPECIGKRGEIPTGLVTKHTSALTDKSVEELQAMDTEDLDRLAFGVTSGDVIEVDPSDILIQYKSDLSNPEEKFRTGGTKWLKSVDLSDPVDVEVHKDGKLYLADGHHRWFAASKLGKKLRALVEVKANPVVYLTEGPRRRLELVGAYTEQSRIGVLGDVYASNNEELPEHQAIAEVDVSDLSETRCVIALSKDMIMGIATWDDELEVLEIVKVDKSFRRQGVASALIEAAEEAHGGPLTDTGERSAEGEAMLRKLGRRPAPLSRRIDEREAESLGAMLIARLYRSLANDSFKERVKSDWQPF